MPRGAGSPFGARLKSLREQAGYTQEELSTISGLSVNAISALERGERRRPQAETVRALAAALELNDAAKTALMASARDHASTTPADLRPPMIPAPPTPLIGRDDEVREIEFALTTGPARLVTITGPGGVGKTRVALALAQRAASEGTGEVYFVALAAIRDAALVAPAIAEAFGIPDVNAGQLAERLHIARRDRQTLMVLDNFEQVTDAAPVVAALLAHAPSLRIIVTSRSSLRIRGEREFPLAPLPLPTGAGPSVSEAMLSPAVRLFVERGRDANPRFQIDGPTTDAVIRLCERLDGLPLAIELAAPWLKLLTPQALLARLGQRASLTSPGAVDLPDRQRTMRATVEWSYDLLEPASQRLFRHLAVCPGPFTVDTATALAGPDVRAEEALDQLASLVDKSLVQRHTTESSRPSTFRMLEVVRASAAEWLEESGERATALDALARYVSKEVDGAVFGLLGADQEAWLDRLHFEHDTIRAALGWLLERERYDEAATIAWSVNFFWYIQGHVVEGARWWDRILAADAALSQAARARALAGAAALAAPQGNLAGAEALARRAIRDAEASNTKDALGGAENILGVMLIAAHRLDEAAGCFERTRAIGNELGVVWASGSALTGLGHIALARGDLDAAERWLDEAASVLRAAGSSWNLGLSLNSRALIALLRDDPATCLRLVGEAFAILRRLRDASAVSYSLCAIAAALVMKGDDRAAARVFGASEALARATGITLNEPYWRKLRDRAFADLRARMDPGELARAMTAGHTISSAQIIADLEDRI